MYDSTGQAILRVLEDIARSLQPRLPTPPTLSNATIYQLVDMLHANQAAWEGEEGTVQEEHEALMQSNIMLLEAVRKELGGINDPTKV